MDMASERRRVEREGDLLWLCNCVSLQYFSMQICYFQTTFENVWQPLQNKQQWKRRKTKDLNFQLQWWCSVVVICVPSTTMECKTTRIIGISLQIHYWWLIARVLMHLSELRYIEWIELNNGSEGREWAIKLHQIYCDRRLKYVELGRTLKF